MVVVSAQEVAQFSANKNLCTINETAKNEIKNQEMQKKEERRKFK